MSKLSHKAYAPITVRIAVSLIFLWFGISQLVNPVSFLGYVPEWFYPHGNEIQHEHPLQSIHSLPFTAHALIMGNGAFETVFGTLLLLGVFTRIASLLLAIHLIGITIGLGYNDIAVRDFGLAMATFSVFLNGNDKWCLKQYLPQK